MKPLLLRQWLKLLVLMFLPGVALADQLSIEWLDVSETSLSITVSVESTFEVDSISLDFAGIKDSLTPEYDDALGQTLWRTELDISSLPSVEYLGTFEVTDVLRNSFTVDRTILLNREPILTVSRPLARSVARPFTPVLAACVDDRGDCLISLEVNDGGGWSEYITYSNYAREMIDLSEFDGSDLDLRLRVVDSDGREGKSDSRVIHVESSKYLDRIYSIAEPGPGAIIEVEGERVLEYFSDIEGGKLVENLRVRNIDSASIATLPVNVIAGETLPVGKRPAFLSDKGFVYSAVDSLRAGFFDSESGSRTDFDSDGGEVVQAVSDYTVVRFSHGLARIHIASGASLDIEGRFLALSENGVVTSELSDSTDPSIIIKSVSATGYSEQTEINDLECLDSGQVRQVPAFLTGAPIATDGESIIFEAASSYCDAIHRAGLYLLQEGSISSLDPIKGGIEKGRMNPGAIFSPPYFAYQKFSQTQTAQIHLRDEQGNDSLRTFYSTDSVPEALGSNGELIFTNSSRR